jgi:hypothetical protein
MRAFTIALTALLVAATAQADPGEDLYSGRLPMEARLRGDSRPLAQSAARCVNCHEPGPRQSLADTAYAPRLDKTSLATSNPRRGGPSSVYDEQSFCRLLREGIDPAYMLLRRSMPVFEVDDAQCASLWQYLSQRAAQEAGSK